MGPPGPIVALPATGFEVLRRAVALVLAVPAAPGAESALESLLLSGADVRASRRPARSSGGAAGRGRSGRVDGPSGGEDPGTDRIAALVDLARAGDAEAFGLLYDHYADRIYRFLYARLGQTALAEDLTSETFFRALRSISSFTWQGRDFGAWLTTIARNLVTDHYKSSRSRLEVVANEVPERVDTGAGPETQVLASLTSAALVEAMRKLAPEQLDCLVLRFCQGLSIAETAASLGRSEGAVKQLQLRAVRNLAKLVPEDLR
ncbi:MAG: sigma-70 family RNA polymerase sigma factor [Nocardioidaceae bacterium]